MSNPFLGRSASFIQRFEAGASQHPNVRLVVVACEFEKRPHDALIFLHAHLAWWRRWMLGPPENLSDPSDTSFYLDMRRSSDGKVEERAYLYGNPMARSAFIIEATRAGQLLGHQGTFPPLDPRLNGVDFCWTPLSCWIGCMYDTLRKLDPSRLLTSMDISDNGTQYFGLDVDPWEASVLTAKILDDPCLPGAKRSAIEDRTKKPQHAIPPPQNATPPETSVESEQIALTSEEAVKRFLLTPEASQIEHALQWMVDAKRHTGLTERKIGRTQAWKDHNEQMLKHYLERKPDCTLENIAQIFGWSPAKTSPMTAWQEYMARKEVVSGSVENLCLQL